MKVFKGRSMGVLSEKGFFDFLRVSKVRTLFWCFVLDFIRLVEGFW